MRERPEHKVMAFSLLGFIVAAIGYGVYYALAWLAKAAGWV